jgi:formylglycine-generating enzyme required for sulfatase activity
VASGCNAAVGRPRCVPEDFAAELTDARAVLVESFWLDRCEVRIAEYARCVTAGVCSDVAERGADATFGPERGELPRTWITHAEAATYCAFRGARLPTELEFESAARGARRRAYPWGSSVHSALANSGVEGPELVDARDGFAGLAPVDAFAAGSSPEGVRQLAGNAAEWTDSWFSRYGEPPSGAGTERAVRGGHFAAAPWHLRGASRAGVPPEQPRATVGFRCARSGRGP